MNRHEVHHLKYLYRRLCKHENAKLLPNATYVLSQSIPPIERIMAKSVRRRHYGNIVEIDGKPLVFEFQTIVCFSLATVCVATHQFASNNGMCLIYWNRKSKELQTKFWILTARMTILSIMDLCKITCACWILPNAPTPARCATRRVFDQSVAGTLCAQIVTTWNHKSVAMVRTVRARGGLFLEFEFTYHGKKVIHFLLHESKRHSRVKGWGERQCHERVHWLRAEEKRLTKLWCASGCGCMKNLDCVLINFDQATTRSNKISSAIPHTKGIQSRLWWNTSLFASRYQQWYAIYFTNLNEKETQPHRILVNHVHAWCCGVPRIHVGAKRVRGVTMNLYIFQKFWNRTKAHFATSRLWCLVADHFNAFSQDYSPVSSSKNTFLSIILQLMTQDLIFMCVPF